MNETDALWQIITPMSEGFWLALDLLFGAFFWFGVRFVSVRWRNLALIARWLAIPYLGLVAGGVSPRLMGLTGVDWRNGLALGVGLIAAVCGLLFVVHATNGDARLVARPVLPSQSAKDGITLADRVFGVLASGAEEFHWCFLRATLLAVILSIGGGSAQASYGAIWLAGLIALPEALLAAPSASLRLYQTITLLATTILFLFVHNFWLCWALHASVMLFAGNVRWPAAFKAE
jgi:hypothetical protein